MHVQSLIRVAIAASGAAYEARLAAGGGWREDRRATDDHCRVFRSGDLHAMFDRETGELLNVGCQACAWTLHYLPGPARFELTHLSGGALAPSGGALAPSGGTLEFTSHDQLARALAELPRPAAAIFRTVVAACLV